MFGWPKISSDNRKKMSEHSIKFAMCPKLIMEESSVLFAELYLGLRLHSYIFWDHLLPFYVIEFTSNSILKRINTIDTVLVYWYSSQG